MKNPLHTRLSSSGITIVVGACLVLSRIPAQAQTAGAQAYSAACQRCHSVAQVLRWMERYPDAAKRAAYLDGKLTTHYAADVRLRADIVAYLEAEYSGGGRRGDAELDGVRTSRSVAPSAPAADQQKGGHMGVGMRNRSGSGSRQKGVGMRMGGPHMDRSPAASHRDATPE